jgi:hypothetical protein
VILGVAQVVLNLPEIEPARHALAAAGYELSFEERGIPNHPAKAPFQGVEREALDMVHLAAPGALAVELTAYSGGPPAGRAAFGLAAQDGGLFEVDAPATAPARAVVAATDSEASERFWSEGLGFRPAAGGHLEYRAVLPDWRFEIELRPDGGAAGETTVDAHGCVLVTMLATHVERELERLAGGLSLRSTAAWQEQVAGRPLTVALVEGPSGELVELLQAPARDGA